MVLLTGRDEDNDELSYTILSKPVHGILSGTPPRVIYTPNPGFAGEDSFTFSLSDGIASSESTSIALTVSEPENESEDDAVPASCAPDCAVPLAAVLPGSRSVVVNTQATVFATLINPADIDASGVANPSVDIPPFGASAFVLALTPREEFPLTALEFDFVCANTGHAPVALGLNTRSSSTQRISGAGQLVLH